MTGIDKEKLKQGIDSASPEQLEQILAILGVQNDTKAQTDNITNSVVAEPSTSEPVEAAQVQVENVEVDPRLTKFAEMYMKWSRVSKNRMKWERVQTALLANHGELINTVNEIPNGAIMFGADLNGNILFANGGLKPMFLGIDYEDAVNAVKELGMELFPFKSKYYEARDAVYNDKGDEQNEFESFTGHLIVCDDGGNMGMATWLKGNEGKYDKIGLRRLSKPISPTLRFGCSLDVDFIEAKGDTRCGVRALLRAKA